MKDGTKNSAMQKAITAKNSTKLFFSGVIILTVSNIIIKAIGLLFKIPMNHVVGDTGMGYYTSAYTIYTLLYMISTAGLPVAVSKLISESRAQGKIKQARNIFKITLRLFVIVGFSMMALMFIAAKWYSTVIVGAPPTYACIYAIAPTLFFVCITSAFRGYFQGYQQMIPTAISQLIESVCKLAIGILAALYAINKGYEIYVVAAYAAIGLTVGVFLGTVFLAISKILFKPQKYDEEYLSEVALNDECESTGTILKRLVTIAIPITLSASVMSLTNVIDAVLVQHLLQFTGMTQEAATTIYGNYTTLAVPMFNLPTVLINPIGYSIIPLISVTNGAGNTQKSKMVMESALRVTVILALPCAIGLTVLAGPILSLFYVESSVATATPLLMLLAPSSFFVCILTVTNAILQATGNERMPLISMLVGGAVKIAMNCLLIGTIGMAATPISTLICYVAATLLNFVFVIRRTNLAPKFSKTFMRPLVAGIVCGVSAGAFFMLYNWLIGGRIATLMAIITAAVIYFLFVFLTKTVTDDDIKLLPKGEKIAKLLKKTGILR